MNNGKKALVSVLTSVFILLAVFASVTYAATKFSAAADKFFQRNCQRSERTTGLIAFLCDLRIRVDGHDQQIDGIELTIDEYEEKIENLESRITNIENILPTPTPTPTPLPPDDGTPFEATLTRETQPQEGGGYNITVSVTANKPLKSCSINICSSSGSVSNCIGSNPTPDGNTCSKSAGFGQGSEPTTPAYVCSIYDQCKSL